MKRQNKTTLLLGILMLLIWFVGLYTNRIVWFFIPIIMIINEKLFGDKDEKG